MKIHGIVNNALLVFVVFLFSGLFSSLCDVHADELDWQARVSSGHFSWIAYGNGMYFAGGGLAGEYISSDGINWTSSAVSVSGNSLVFGEGLFVSLTQSGGVVDTSPDGVNWTESATLGEPYWYALTYGNGLFVAVDAYLLDTATSTDGINWTKHTGGISNNYWQDMVYGDGLYLAGNVDNGTIATSPDGITWTDRSSGASRVESMTYGNSLYVVAQGTVDDAVFTSDDGITWTERVMPSSRDWSVVGFGDNQFVALADDSGSGNYYATSPDGINWTEYAMTPTGKSWRNIVYADGQFTAVSGDGIVTAAAVGGSGGTSDDVNLSVSIEENMTLDCGSDVDIDGGGVLIPGAPEANATTCTVTTNDQDGYVLQLEDSNTGANTLVHDTLSESITDLTAWDASTPNATAWIDATTEGLGFSVYDSTATKNDTWWGTGVSCHDANNLYAGIPDNGSAQDIMEHTSYAANSTTTSICYRVDVPMSQASGEYTGAVTYTATGRP